MDDAYHFQVNHETTQSYQASYSKFYFNIRGAICWLINDLRPIWHLGSSQLAVSTRSISAQNMELKAYNH